MTFDVGNVLSDAFERLTTRAGAILVVGLTIVGIVRTAAIQDLVRTFLEWFRDQLEDPEIRDQLTAEEVETIEREIDTTLSELPLALGLSPELAALLWLVGFVLSLVIVVIAIDAFTYERDALDGLETDRIGWKTLNLLVGWIAFGILFLIGLILFVLPGILVGLFLVFFAAAIVIDDESFLSAFASSIDVVRDNFLGTLGIVLLSLGAFIGLGFVGSAVGAILPALPAAVLGDLLSAVGQAFALALIARAYVDATADEPGADGPDPGEPTAL